MTTLRASISLATLALAGALSAPACGPGKAPGDDPARGIVARVGDHQVARDEFEAYLAETTGGTGEVAAADAEVKSRLLDQFLDEELLLAAAQDAGITVSDEEVRHASSGQQTDSDRVRRALIQRKFKQQAILAGVAVSDDEVRRYFEAHMGEFERPARVVLRKVLMDSVQEAREVREQIEGNPEAFEAIAAERSLSPDGGQPQAYEEHALPDSIRAAVGGLDQGGLSAVVEDPQGFFIVRLEERQPERSAKLEEVDNQIRLKLLREKSQDRYREFVGSLRGRTTVEIFEDRLPFNYVKKGPS